MNAWQHHHLADLCSTITVGHVGSMASEYTGQGIPFLRSKNVRPGRLNFSDLAFIGDSFHQRLKKSQLRANDIVIVRTGTPGAAALIPEELGPANCSDIIIARPSESVNPRFLCYAINATAGSFVAAHTVGAVQQHFNIGSAQKLQILIPSRAEQHSISGVLGALDDKIAVNERIANTAYELAEALYIRDSAVEQGWPEIALSDTAKWMSGGTPTTSEPSYWDGDIPWISAASLKSPWLDDSERKVTRLGAKNGTRLVPTGTIIFVVRGMSLTSEFRVGLTQREVAFGQDCKALIPHPGIDPVVLLLALRSRTKEILGLVDTAGHGTGRLGTDRIEKLRVRLPEGGAATAFAETVRPLAQRAGAVRRENRTLSDLRDTLLPQLVTGKIRIKDAERVVEDATS
ncbi:restriction endonuclease subunit S [Streptomyces sp. NPDC020747]|uniref:restriction endonuclease subunit S n=1 Tax=Streptomyces sp. NPDC020747 TaxID=3365086 RepID=UPI0037B5A81A